MSFQGVFPFWCTRIIYLRAFWMPYPCVNMVYPFEYGLYGIFLIMQQTLVHITPV